MRLRIFIALLNIWPPLLGAGIRVKRISKDYREVDVEMKLRCWNRNYVGVHYGGSLYSMTDPFFMLMIMENLGAKYIVWDKAAAIKFKKPGRGTVRCAFRLTADQLTEVRKTLETQEKTEPVFTALVRDLGGEVIAEVQKTVYIRNRVWPSQVYAEKSLD